MDTTRRRLLAASGSLGAVGIAGCSGVVTNVRNRLDGDHTLTGEYAVTEFVEREGAEFVLDGDPYRYSGMMALDVPRLDEGKAWVNTAMDVATRYDIGTYRCWGFTHKPGSPPVHQAPGEFDDTWLELFDYTVAKAKEAGVRLVVPLLQGVYKDVSAERNHAPSPAAYATWADLDGIQRNASDAFIESTEANDYYKEYIEHVLERENQYTGIQYKDEPTVLMWECANELEYGHPERIGDSMADWYSDIAGYIKSIDSNHLVSTGMHGSMGEIFEPWTERNAFVADHEVPEIDACSVHHYPVHRAGEEEGALEIKSPELSRRYIEHKVRLAHEEIGKPVYIGEYGTMFKPDAETAYVTQLETEEEASDIENDGNVPMAFEDQHDDGVVTRRRVEIDGVGLDTRRAYFQGMVDIAERMGIDGVHYWTLAYDYRPADSEEAQRQHRAEYDSLIIYATEDETLSIVETHHDRVATGQ